MPRSLRSRANGREGRRPCAGAFVDSPRSSLNGPRSLDYRLGSSSGSSHGSAWPGSVVHLAAPPSEVVITRVPWSFWGTCESEAFEQKVVNGYGEPVPKLITVTSSYYPGLRGLTWKEEKLDEESVANGGDPDNSRKRFNMWKDTDALLRMEGELLAMAELMKRPHCNLPCPVPWLHCRFAGLKFQVALPDFPTQVKGAVLPAGFPDGTHGAMPRDWIIFWSRYNITYTYRCACFLEPVDLPR